MTTADCTTCGSTATTAEHRKICADNAAAPVQPGQRVRITGGRYAGIEQCAVTVKANGWITIELSAWPRRKEVWIHPDNWTKA